MSCPRSLACAWQCVVLATTLSTASARSGFQLLRMCAFRRSGCASERLPIARESDHDVLVRARLLAWLQRSVPLFRCLQQSPYPASLFSSPHARSLSRRLAFACPGQLSIVVLRCLAESLGVSACTSRASDTCSTTPWLVVCLRLQVVVGYRRARGWRRSSRVDTAHPSNQGARTNDREAGSRTAPLLS
jgi:hypothetical protein